MANFIRLEGTKQYLNLDFVTMVTEYDDDSVVVEVIDRKENTMLMGNDAKNLLSALYTEIRTRRPS